MYNVCSTLYGICAISRRGVAKPVLHGVLPTTLPSNAKDLLQICPRVQCGPLLLYNYHMHMFVNIFEKPRLQSYFYLQK